MLWEIYLKNIMWRTPQQNCSLACTAVHCRAFDADKDDRLSFKEWQVGFYLLILLPKVADRDEDVNGGGNDDDEDVNGDSNDDDEDVDGDRDQDVDGDSSDVYRHRCHTLPILHLMILWQ